MEPDARTMMALTTMILPLMGISMALTPYLMRKGECFAVTVPSAANDDAYLKKLKRTFALTMLALTTLLTALALACATFGDNAGVLASMTIGALFLCIAHYALMLAFRKKTMIHKELQGWEAAAQESTALIGESGIPHAISLKWNLLYLPIILTTMLIGYLGYGLMPDTIPVHAGFDGTVNGWTAKSPMIVLAAPAIQGFFAACLIFSHWSITRSKRVSDPEAPAASALAYGMFARAQSIYLLAMGLCLCAAMIAMPLSFMGLLTLMQAGALAMAVALLAVVGALAIGLVYGQGGARMLGRMKESDALPADDDEHWKLGVLYLNAEDPSIFLPERFGVGWTVNWARPTVWAIMAAGLAATIAFCVAVTVALT